MNEKSVNLGTPWMVTVPEATKISGIPECHLRKLIKEGILPYYRAGTRYYIDVNNLKDVLHSHQ